MASRALCSHPATAPQSSSKRPNWIEAAMLEQLEQRINEVGALQTKLVLLIGRPGSGKSALIGALAKQRGIPVMNVGAGLGRQLAAMSQRQRALQANVVLDRKSTRLNSSHVRISYAVFCLKKKKKQENKYK